MTCSRTLALLLIALATGCVADPISGGDSLSGTGSGSGGGDEDGASTDDSATSGAACLDVADPGLLAAYDDMIDTAAARMDALEGRFDDAVASLPVDTPAELMAEISVGFEGSFGVWIDWIHCEYTDGFFVDARALCSDANDPLQCTGPHGCDAECTGPVYVPGPASCPASCVGACTLGAAATCEGWCTGTCDANGGTSMVADVCEGTCEGGCELGYGACEGTCEGGCHGGGIQGAPMLCAGECIGSASDCVGPVTVEPSTPCSRIASVAAVSGPSCAAPQVVFPLNLSADIWGDADARQQLRAWLDALEPGMGELFAIAHQVRMMQDAMVEPPCGDTAEHEGLTDRLAALDAALEPWLLPLADPSPPL